MECVEKIIKKDWIHPLTGEKLTEKDIIPLQRVSNFTIIWPYGLFFKFCTYFMLIKFGNHSSLVNEKGWLRV